MSGKLFDAATEPSFPVAAKRLVGDTQTRKNVRHATDVIQGKRDQRVAEQADWQQLREAGRGIREHALAQLDTYLEQFERNCTAAGGTVHWARDAADARRIVIDLAKATGSPEAIKIKSMTTEEIGLNPALDAAGIHAIETDLAELIIQLGDDRPSHIVVPALHKNRQQIREIFAREMHLPDLGDKPSDLTEAARKYLRHKFLTVPLGICGANFLCADTGGVCVVESEGNGRMCLTLPTTLVCIAGIDKVIPRFSDMEVFLQLLPRSATGERMNPYNSVWTGVHAGDGPRAFHVVLLDNGRSDILRDAESRSTLHCIRCGACQNACPVYRQTGGHAYGSVYAGPIGAILTPQLNHMEHMQSLPYASSLCGACYEVCPVKINIPEILVHLRGEVVQREQLTIKGKLAPEAVGMKVMAAIFANSRRLRAAQRLARWGQKPLVGRKGWVQSLPGMLGGWTQVRDLMPVPKEAFRDWWEKREKNQPQMDADSRR
jgi:L-lactate dehydrogenase complex protein LldF